MQWNIDTFSQVKDYGKVHNSAVMSMTVSPDSLNLFSGTEQGYLKQFSTKKQSIMHNFDKVHNGPITSMAPTPNNKFLITCSLREVKQWNISGKKCVRNFAEGLDGYLAFYSLCISPCSNFFYTCTWDGEVKSWNIGSGKEEKTFPKIDEINFLIATADGKQLLCCDRKGKMFGYNLELDKESGTWANHKKEVNYMVQTSDGKQIFSADGSGAVVEWNSEENKIEKMWGEVVGTSNDDNERVHNGSILAMALSHLKTDPTAGTAK